MGRKGKYKRRLSRKEKERRSIVIAITFVVCLIFYLYIIRKGITFLQWSLFSNLDTILLVPSLGLWAFLEIIGGPIFIIATICYLKYKKDEERTNEMQGNTIKNKTSYNKTFVMTIIISFTLVLISFFSYCRVDKNGLFVREVRTLFLEKEFSWDAVKSVEINYYRNSKGSGHNLQYFINFDGFRVNIQNAGLTSNHEALNQSKKEIHAFIKEMGIPVYKNIEEHDDKINEFLNIIGE